jgi:hypothetical protein
VRLDERIRDAKARFRALEAIESEDGDMVPIILRHLSYVSCLLGNNRPKDALPPPTIDPASISLFDKSPPMSTCPATIHTFLPPCTHQRPVRQPVAVLDDAFFDICESYYYSLFLNLMENCFRRYRAQRWR